MAKNGGSAWPYTGKGLPDVPKHLILPKSAFKDVRSLLRLDEEKLHVLGDLFATSDSISATSTDFIQKVAQRLGLDAAAVHSAVIVCQFLLTVVEDDHPPKEVLDDVREFVALNAPPEDAAAVTELEAKRATLESLLTPKPERSKALKVRYLGREVYPTVESFRTVCELRPVFERKGGENEEIVGYVPVVLLEANTSSPDENKIVLHLTPRLLKSLGEIVQRAEGKLAAIRRKFGDELLGDQADG